MKKTHLGAIIATMMLFPYVILAQIQKTFLEVPNKTTTFKNAYGKGQIVFEADSGKFYRLTDTVKSGQTMGGVFTEGTFQKVPKTLIGYPSIVNDTLYPKIILFRDVPSNGIKFPSPTAYSQENAYINIGTWTTPLTVKAQTQHFVPIQVNIKSTTSVSKDIAAARFRVDTDDDTASTNTAVNGLEMRSKLQSNVGSHANLQVSTEVSQNITNTGDLAVIYASLQGSGNVTSSNNVGVTYFTNTNTGTGIDFVSLIMNNGGTVTDIAKLQNLNSGTATSGLNITNTSGNVTNAIKNTGTFTYDMVMQNGETMSNSSNGYVDFGGAMVTVNDTGHFFVSGHVGIDSSGFTYSAWNTNNWISWATKTNNVANQVAYINLDRIGDIAIADKTGTTSTKVAVKDTTGASVKWKLQNLSNVSTQVLTVAPIADTTSVGYTPGAIFLRVAGGDTSLWMLVANTGTIAHRWKKITTEL